MSHWVLLEFSGVVALCLRRGVITAPRGLAIHADFECFRQERLSLLEPRGADQGLANAAEALDLPFQLITDQV